MGRPTLVAIAISLAAACAIEETGSPDEAGVVDTGTTASTRASSAHIDDGTTTTDSSEDAIAPDSGSEPTDAAGSEEAKEEERSLTPQVPERVPTSEGAAAVGEVPESLLKAIVADAAAQVGIPREDIEVIRAEFAVWADGSLGCPEPGVAYTDAPVDGYWVVFDAASEDFDYRATTSGFFRRCTAGIVSGPPG